MVWQEAMDLLHEQALFEDPTLGQPVPPGAPPAQVYVFPFYLYAIKLDYYFYFSYYFDIPF